MIAAQQALARAMAADGVSFRPASVWALVLLRGNQVVDKLVFNQSANSFLSDPLVGTKLYDVMHGLRDFMRDTFGSEDQCICCGYDDWWFVAWKTGGLTVVAMSSRRAVLYPIEEWVRQVGLQLPAP